MSAQCPYCGAAIFHEGARSTQYQCRTTAYDDGPASRSQVCRLTADLAEVRATLSRVEAERDALANDPAIQSLLRCRESGASLFFNAEFEGVEFADGSDGKRTKVRPYTPRNPNPTRNPLLCTQFVHDHLDATTEGEKP